MSELNVADLLSVQQAIEILDSVAVRPRTVRVPLAQVNGLRLAEALFADRDFPSFDKSLMDGYAVRRIDVSAVPVDLRLIGEVAAGQWPGGIVGPGEAMAIMTGAPLPAGADGVVPVEDAEKVDPATVRVVRGEGDPARFIARRGTDCHAGEAVLPIGVRMGPAQIAVAASVGAAEVDIFAAPRVAVLATGDELVSANEKPGPSQIRNSNSPMLIALLRRMGCEVTDLGTVADRIEDIREALRHGLTFDALFVSGGMSMGDYDHVPRLLKEIGVDLKITKLRIKPGKPFVFGAWEGERKKCDAETRGHGEAENGYLTPSGPPLPVSHYVFGLPGNPVSGFVCTVCLASRVLARLAGGNVEEAWRIGTLNAPLPANGPREFYQPAIYRSPLDRTKSQLAQPTVTPLKWKGSADLFTLAQANALLIRTENEPALEKGALVRVLEI